MTVAIVNDAVKDNNDNDDDVGDMIMIIKRCYYVIYIVIFIYITNALLGITDFQYSFMFKIVFIVIILFSLTSICFSYVCCGHLLLFFSLRHSYHVNWTLVIMIIVIVIGMHGQDREGSIYDDESYLPFCYWFTRRDLVLSQLFVFVVDTIVRGNWRLLIFMSLLMHWLFVFVYLFYLHLSRIAIASGLSLIVIVLMPYLLVFLLIYFYLFVCLYWTRSIVIASGSKFVINCHYFNTLFIYFFVYFTFNF